MEQSQSNIRTPPCNMLLIGSSLLMRRNRIHRSHFQWIQIETIISISFDTKCSLTSLVFIPTNSSNDKFQAHLLVGSLAAKAADCKSATIDTSSVRVRPRQFKTLERFIVQSNHAR